MTYSGQHATHRRYLTLPSCRRNVPWSFADRGSSDHQLSLSILESGSPNDYIRIVNFGPAKHSPDIISCCNSSRVQKNTFALHSGVSLNIGARSERGPIGIILIEVALLDIRPQPLPHLVFGASPIL